MAVASRKGVSGVVHEAVGQRVVLTSYGRPVAVVDSAERLDEDARLLRETRLAVLDAAADLIAQRSEKFSLDQVCERLGVDVQRVRALAAERAQGAPGTR
jgi:PHD/YefM family antitoxin component YafN of YafNO toxin-antitoxin module